MSLVRLVTDEVTIQMREGALEVDYRRACMSMRIDGDTVALRRASSTREFKLTTDQHAELMKRVHAADVLGAFEMLAELAGEDRADAQPSC